MRDDPRQSLDNALAGFAIEAFEGEKLHRTVAASFDTVVARLSAELGRLSADEVNVLAAEAADHAAFGRAVQARLGSSGFVVLGVIDHGTWLRLFGHEGRLERWFVGNPLIAETMIAEDRVAGLFAPVELLIDEVGPADPDHPGASVDTDRAWAFGSARSHHRDARREAAGADRTCRLTGEGPPRVAHGGPFCVTRRDRPAS